jgi:hypothetical protein
LVKARTNLANHFLWINKNFVTHDVAMSEEPINRKDDIEQDVRDTADNAEEGYDEAGHKIKAGAKAMGNKIKDPNSDLSTEFKEEKLKEEVKDI